MKGKNITFIVGAGAVENSWNPVIRAISNTFNIETNSDGANFLFARNVYLLKTYSIFAKRDHYPQIFDIAKSNISILKQNIASELKKAQISGEIKPRKNLQEIVNKFVTLDVDKVALVSTNWDEVIDMAINKLYRWGRHPLTKDIDCYHIHGSISLPDMLYLPSEITLENYRSRNEENKMGDNHRFFMSLLSEVNKTILYGISLDPLDAELNQSLAAGWVSQNLEEVIIINPDHERVAKRVKLLLDEDFPAKITGYHPNDLNRKIEYM